MAFCVYCGKDKPLTDEHALPRSLGGDIPGPGPLRIKVCKRCNDVAGRFVDAPLARSFFILNERADPGNHPATAWPDAPMPLGPNAATTSAGQQVDVWMYLGHVAFHVHDPYPASDETVEHYGQPIRKPGTFDAGSLFLQFHSKQESAQAFAAVVKEFFGGAPRYALQEILPSNPFPPHPTQLDEAHALCRDLVANGITGRPIFAIAGTDRFAAKIGLALASTVIGPTYLEDQCCPEVRNVMWAEHPDHRDRLRLKAQGILSSMMAGAGGLAEFIGIPGCHAFWLTEAPGVLAMVGILYGKYQVMAILCDCGTTHLPPSLHDGAIVVASLRTRRISNPVRLAEFIAWKGPHQQASTTLDALGITAVQRQPPTFPPPQ